MVEPKADNVSRAAAALVTLGEPEALEHGLVERDTETHRYRLGWQLFALAAQVGDQRLLGIAGPLLASLVDRVGERASLTVLRGPDVLTVSSQAPHRAVQTIGWVGRTVPSYCTSSGRALLLDRRREELVRLFAQTRFDPFGPNSPRDVDALHRRIVASRARGFTVVAEEFAPELVAAAAPVRDARGGICAAVNVSAPKYRLGGAGRLAALGRAIKEVADEMSELLGEGADPGTTGHRPRP